MPPETATLRTLDSLKDLTRLVQTAEGFHPLVASLKNGHGATVDGAWGSSSALVAAALGLHAPRTLLVVIPFPRDLDGWTEDLASFSGARPVVFPAWDNLPGESTVLDEVAGQRLRVLKQLESAEPPRYLLTTFQALIQPVPDRAQLAQRRRVLRVGEQIDPDVLAGWLVDMGYKRTEVVELPGEFSRRGGVMDIFSPDIETPYRLDFFGDEIESIRHFSQHNQRSIGDPLPSAELTGATLEQPGVNGNGKTTAAGLAFTGHLCDYLAADAWTLLV
ncbi:MAG: transcription-repair coupling factor, partial [Planctomycetota bacterium]